MDKKYLYGLLHSSENCFYLVSHNYHAMKILQMLLLRQRFFYCVNISKLETPVDPTEINNENCHLLGGSKPLIRHIILDPDPKDYGINLIKVSSTPNEILKNNLRLLYKLIEESELFFQQVKKLAADRFEDPINGLKELGVFVSTFVPNDPNIKEFVEIEINEKEKAISRCDNIRSDLWSILIDSDYYRNDLKIYLQEKINVMTSSEHDTLQTLKKVLQGKVWRLF